MRFGLFKSNKLNAASILVVGVIAATMTDSVRGLPLLRQANNNAIQNNIHQNSFGSDSSVLISAQQTPVVATTPCSYNPSATAIPQRYSASQSFDTTTIYRGNVCAGSLATPSVTTNSPCIGKHCSKSIPFVSEKSISSIEKSANTINPSTTSTSSQELIVPAINLSSKKDLNFNKVSQYFPPAPTSIDFQIPTVAPGNVFSELLKAADDIICDDESENEITLQIETSGAKAREETDETNNDLPANTEQVNIRPCIEDLNEFPCGPLSSFPVVDPDSTEFDRFINGGNPSLPEIIRSDVNINGSEFKFIQHLGGGQFGDAYLANPTTGLIQESIVVKVEKNTDLEELRARLKWPKESDEKKALLLLGRFRGDGFLDDGSPFLATSHVMGNTLDDFFLGADICESNSQIFNSDLYVRAFNDALWTLHYVGIAHGDLHMGNVLFQNTAESENENGCSKVQIEANIIDFGAAIVGRTPADSQNYDKKQRKKVHSSIAKLVKTAERIMRTLEMK